MSKEKKTSKGIISDVFDSAPKEPNAFEVFDDPKPSQKGNDSLPAAIPPTTWNPGIASMMLRWTITSINTTNMPMEPVNMRFNLNCIRKGDSVVVNIWRYDDGRIVSMTTINGSISDVTPERMVIDVVNPLNSGDTEITITPSDMINNDHIRYTINCDAISGPHYTAIRTMPWNQAVSQSQF